MNSKLLFGLFALTLLGCSHKFDATKLETAFEKSNGRQTATYEEGIEWWKTLEKLSPYVRLQTFGETDAGKPLHLVIINASRNFSTERILKSKKVRWLINNGIHPGEPDGIDASMLFARDILSQPDFESKFDSTVILIIPFYSVGGALNRNCCSRANQNGPESYGFRGNARNLDLNRDFIKCDSKNAQSFNQLFTKWNPDVYLETHVSNGADYPYTLTYLASQFDKLGNPLGEFVKSTLSPELFEFMAKAGDEMIPYVNVFGTSPDAGYTTFYDSPRYSTGYAALHHSIGLLTETHMLKPFDKRVESTRRFLNELSTSIHNHRQEIKKLRQEAIQNSLTQTEFTLDWKIDSSAVSNLDFKGYKARYDTSSVTGLLQLHYDRSAPWEKAIPYYNRMKPTNQVTAPSFYLVPTSWSQVVDRLIWNGVNMTKISHDTSVTVSVYKIVDYKTVSIPYEGHYLHNKTKVESETRTLNLLANSYFLVDLNQAKKRFLIETLEPAAHDSYFNWNFYDEILQEKEYFSSYVFEPEAAEMLKDPQFSKLFEEKKASDSTFSKSASAQLNFLYMKSEHYERDRHMIYPVYRVE